MVDLHVVASESAAGSLRVAVQHDGLSGEVHCVKDSLDLGPLADGHERAAFWHTLLEGYLAESDETESFRDDPFAPWSSLRDRVMSDRPDRLFVWISESGADHVFLRMACHRLRDVATRPFLVAVPPAQGVHAVAVHSPERLATYMEGAVHLSESEVSRLSSDFMSIAARPELLRACDDAGRLRFFDLSAHDELILANCVDDWRSAARIIGHVMASGDGRNPLGDVFVNSRLRHLIKAGRLEADNLRGGMRACRVRRRSSCSRVSAPAPDHGRR